MWVGTGEPHGFSEEAAFATENQFAFTVKPVPRVDFAQKALWDAQQAYFAAYPETRDMPGMQWWIESSDPDVIR